MAKDSSQMTDKKQAQRHQGTEVRSEKMVKGKK